MLPAEVVRIEPDADGAGLAVILRVQILLPSPFLPALPELPEPGRGDKAREYVRAFLEGAWGQLSPEQQGDVRALLPEIEPGLGDGTLTIPPEQIADVLDRLHEVVEQREADELQARCQTLTDSPLTPEQESDLRRLTELARGLGKRRDRRQAGVKP